MNAALGLEHTAVAAYRVGLPLLTGSALRAARVFHEHEREHADALARAIRALGGIPNRASALDEYTRGFPRLRARDDVLSFALDVENTALAAYIDALPQLSRGELRQRVAAIATAEAEHMSVLLGALGKPQVPHAFVTGKDA
jgi:rubrerythrin